MLISAKNKIRLYSQLDPYSLSEKEKKNFFQKEINLLTAHHYKNSKEYRQILNFMSYKLKNNSLKNIPFLPARLFKEHDLSSVPKKKILKTLVSSGTTGNAPSRIILDNETANNQRKVLSKIISTILGSQRLPMLIIDQNPNLTDRHTFNARATAIYGFSTFGKNHTYLLNKNNEIDYILLNDFLKKFGNKFFFIFGFTSLVFENLLKKLSTHLLKFNFKNGILLHGGGWKKMEKIKINNKIFKEKLFKKLKLDNIYNYYGLVEQTGSIFLECKKCSCFVTSIFSDILIRDKHFNIVQNGNKGFIHLFSLLPKSYPGHSILTEDIGEIVNNINCECHIKGTRFLVHGRAEQSEIRGCSDI